MRRDLVMKGEYRVGCDFARPDPSFCDYSPEENPTTDWGDLLSNKFSLFMSQQAVQPDAAARGE